MYDVVISGYGHDIDLVSVRTNCVRYIKNDHCIIDVPGFGVCVEPDS